MHGQILAPQQDDHSRCSHHPGHQRGDGHALHAPVQAEDQNGVARHIHHIHAQGHPHGDLGIAHDPEQCRSGVIDRQKRDGRLHDHVIGVGIGSHVRLHLSEHHSQHKALAQIEQHHDGQGYLCHEQQQLLARVARLGLFPPPQILSGDDGAAGGQGGKCVDQQHVHRIHQGDGGDGRLTHLGYHHRVAQAHRDGQELFDHQRDNQLPQVLLRKFHRQLCLFHVLASLIKI